MQLAQVNGAVQLLPKRSHTPVLKQPLPPLTTSVQHVQNKQFELFYDPAIKTGQRRLRKYIVEKKGQGWVQLPTSQKYWQL